MEISTLSKNFKPDRKLDCLKLYCPEPVVRTKIEIDKMQVGEILEVVADDPAAEMDIKSLIKNIEQEILQFHVEDDIVRFIIRKVK